MRKDTKLKSSPSCFYRLLRSRTTSFIPYLHFLSAFPQFTPSKAHGSHKQCCYSCLLLFQVTLLTGKNSFHWIFVIQNHVNLLTMIRKNGGLKYVYDLTLSSAWKCSHLALWITWNCLAYLKFEKRRLSKIIIYNLNRLKKKIILQIKICGYIESNEWVIWLTN